MQNEKVRERLANEPVIWMTTVRADGQPQTSVIWFLLEGDEILMYSKDGTIRNRNVLVSPMVALNLDGNGRGGAVVTIEGTARIDDEAPSADKHEAYVAKYKSFMDRNGWTPEDFAGRYPVAIRTTIDKLRAW